MGTRVKAGKKNKELDLYRIVMIAFVFFIACLVLSLHWFDLDLYWNWVSSNTIGFVLSAFWCQYHEIKAGELLPRYSSFYLKPKMSSVYIQEKQRNWPRRSNAFGRECRPEPVRFRWQLLFDFYIPGNGEGLWHPLMTFFPKRTICCANPSSLLQSIFHFNYTGRELSAIFSAAVMSSSSRLVTTATSEASPTTSVTTAPHCVCSGHEEILAPCHARPT